MVVESIRVEILDITADVFGFEPNELNDQQHLIDDLDATSVMRLEYLVALERHFSIQFDPERIEATQRLGQVIDVVIEYVAATKT
jgi:acyl carrier protein